MGKPIITAIIDTYNHERFIEEAIVSVLEQDFPPSEMEVLVVDDGSTDHTPEIVRRFEPRVRMLRKPNGGQASAFNTGIPEARGEFIAFLDGDDWWAQGKLAAVLEAFEGNPDVGAVGHGYYAVDEAGTVYQSVIPEHKFRLCLRSCEDAKLFCHLRCFLGASKVAYRRDLLEQVLPIPEVLRFEADEYIWTLVVASADALVLDFPLFFYRFHAANNFMQRSRDKSLLRRRRDVMQGLLYHLPARLKSLGVPQEIVAIVMEQIQIDVKRLRLLLDGGMSWETYSVEQGDMRRSYRSTTLGYRIYKQLSLLLALVLPPRRFYQLREWYAANNLRRLRGILGEPEPIAPVVERPVQGSTGNGRR
jgi:glycosyltransferase involved in cell wall biosynthesis